MMGRARKWERQVLPIGEAVFIARTTQGMTRPELASKSGVHRNTILRIENGERPPDLEVLVNLARALGIEVSRIIRKAEKIRPAPHVVLPPC